MMSKEELYNIWAPPESEWSPWVKPTLFSFLDFVPSFQTAADNEIVAPIAAPPAHTPAITITPPVVAPVIAPPAARAWPPDRELDLSFLSRSPAALILDLPGPLALQHALQLAFAGYRPIPLYNATPAPSAHSWLYFSNAIVEVRPILIELIAIARELSRISIRPDAPPAFLLNYNRRQGREPGEGDFDNRSVSFPTDFPSGNMLLSRNIGQAYVIKREDGVVQADLEHILRNWQAAGVQLFVKSNTSSPPRPLEVPPVSRFHALLDRFNAMLGLRRNLLGGFGGVLPAAGSG
jgi:hypothetical protein